MIHSKMSPQKKAFFRFEASPSIGAGHAMRSCVIADDLAEKGWLCTLVTSSQSYDFIPSLKRFNRLEPDDFFNAPPHCDLLVVDHYDLDKDYEMHFRSYAKTIFVIDDLANRSHECDILLDQTYGRNEEVYKHLVPQNCQILVGASFVLLRKEFIQWRDKAIEKRKKTKDIQKILITMGGNDPHNFTEQALMMIKESGFKGAIDIVLGFSAPHIESIKSMTETLSNPCTLYTNADMPRLIYEADLAIGAAGSSTWERCYLGLPSVLMITADNQRDIYNALIHSNNGIFSSLSDAFLTKDYTERDCSSIVSQHFNIDSFLKDTK